ncbi:MAG TPA: DUF1189 family protein [Planctomycetota bacterium]|nr:DUF1189 family protein [Planctomycetota bacterium]HRT97224.1 DUF1189 family protein [Planctomycetota bacterium]
MDYSLLHAPLLAFYSKPFYRAVARHWRGSGVLYPLLLLAVCAIPVSVAIQVRVFRPLAARLSPLVAQVPPITIAGGEVSVEADQPYFIRDARTARPIAILDTTGTITSLQGTDALLLLTRTRLLVRQGADDVVAHDASVLPFRRVDRDLASGWLWWLKGPLALLLYPVFLLLSYLYFLAQGIVCTGVGLLLVRKRRWQFNYHTMMRLSSTATTPAVVLATLALLAGMSAPLPAWLLLCFAITLGYLCYAVRAATELRGSDLGASPDMPSFTPS